MEEFEKLKIRDNIKNEWCKVNDIKLLRLNYSQKCNEIENIVTEFIIENEPKPVGDKGHTVRFSGQDVVC